MVKAMTSKKMREADFRTQGSAAGKVRVGIGENAPFEAKDQKIFLSLHSNPIDQDSAFKYSHFRSSTWLRREQAQSDTHCCPSVPTKRAPWWLASAGEFLIPTLPPAVVG
jgi:hypothetical protein